MKKKKILLFLVFILMFILGINYLGRIIPTINADTSENPSEYNSLEISNSIYYRQTFNNCAPYSVMAVINILKKEIIDPELLAQQIKWRTNKKLTFPQGIVDLLKKYDVSSKNNILWIFKDQEKINWLKNTIDNGKPIIVLVEVNNIQHFYTILGYDKYGFLIYDSLQNKSEINNRKTIVDNNQYHGNRYYTYEQFIDMWKKGGKIIFFRYWALDCRN